MQIGVNELVRGCPNCCMTHGMHSPLARKENDEYHCSINPEHKFLKGTDGFLKSI